MACGGVDSPADTPLMGRAFRSNAEDIESEFLRAVEINDVAQVREILEGNPNLNVDCTDALGRTPLRLAVKNENKDMVETLLEVSSVDNMNAAVLQAIDSAATSIAELALRHPRFQDTSKRMRRMGDHDRFFKPELGSQFPSYVTPLSLAAQKNQFPIVQLLLQRGEEIVRPHKFGCACVECNNKSKFDQFRFKQCRLESYRALASEAYISLNSKDPFLTAFELANELRTLAFMEVCFKSEYLTLADQLSDYTVKLLDRVWTQRELSAVLDKAGLPTKDKFESLARLKLAIEYKEKLFVSHPNCQQRISRLWHQGLGWFGRASWPKTILVSPVALMVYPLAVGVFLAAPLSRVGKFLSQPATKFLSHTVSFLTFLLLIIISSMEEINKMSQKHSLQHFYPELHKTYSNCSANYIYGADFPMRAERLTFTEVMIIIWVIGMVVQECQEIHEQGVRYHFQDNFNIMDFLLLSVYIVSYCLRIIVLLKVRAGIKWLEQGVEVVQSNPHTTNLHLYWMNDDRIWWTDTDPINMAEGLFAMANILSFSRIAYYLPANESLGPLQISLGRMIHDILKFFALGTIVIAAFMVALRNLFWYYANRDRIEIIPNRTAPWRIPDPGVVESYGSEKATFRTVFWAIYGRSSPRGVSLGGYNNTFSEDFGGGLDAMYHVVMMIVMLNILIAMMSRSFELIAADADTEWKFARSALYMDYIKEGNVLPVPLNVLEVPQFFIRVANRCYRKRWGKPNHHKDGGGAGGAGGALSQEPYMASTIDMTQMFKDRRPSAKPVDQEFQEWTELGTTSVAFISRQRLWSRHGLSVYQEVIQSIIQRFIFDVQRENEIAGSGFDDVKNSFEHLKCEVLSEYMEKDTAIASAVETVHNIAKEVALIEIKPKPDPTYRRPENEFGEDLSDFNFIDEFSKGPFYVATAKAKIMKKRRRRKEHFLESSSSTEKDDSGIESKTTASSRKNVAVRTQEN